VMAVGMGNWDEFVRTGGWDVGARPPMALGVEAADTVMAAGRAVAARTPYDNPSSGVIPVGARG
jgi:NADPH:quinone reductase-like Zn-dependent oxidoreductase